MEADKRKQASRALIWRTAAFSGIVVIILAFVLAVSSGPPLEGVGDLAFLIAISCWVGAPLVALGLVRVFRPFPRVSFLMWVVGLVVEAALFYSVFVAPQGSTAALAMIFVPFYLLALYVVVGSVLGVLEERRRRTDTSRNRDDAA